jgi:hypothetical protein
MSNDALLGQGGTLVGTADELLGRVPRKGSRAKG